MISEIKLREIYDILVVSGGAKEDGLNHFMQTHLYNCNITEYRFRGHFGKGGKYRAKTNRVEYYSEDKTPEREKMKQIVNVRLNLLDDEV